MEVVVLGAVPSPGNDAFIEIGGTAAPLRCFDDLRLACTPSVAIGLLVRPSARRHQRASARGWNHGARVRVYLVTGSVDLACGGRLRMVAERDFDDFYLASRPRLLRQLTVMTGDAEQAADVLQEAYTRAWQRWRRVGGLDNPEAWIRTVAWRLAVSQRRRRLVATDHVRRLFGPAEGVVATPHAEEALDVRSALRQLHPEHRRALVLYEMCGLSVPQVAAETGVPEGTVKSRLSRARAALAAVLGPDYVTGDASAASAAEGTVGGTAS